MNVNSAGVSNNTTTFFTPASFAPEPIGNFGNVARNRYHGPGINNTNLIVAKNFALSSDNVRTLQIRLESDNVFNHTQFLNPTANFSSGNFGLINSAAAARQTQLAAKIYFNLTDDVSSGRWTKSKGRRASALRFTCSKSSVHLTGDQAQHFNRRVAKGD
jgi:hypothetical protein